MVATAILKIASFGRNSSTDGPISAKFCVKKQNRMPTKATWNKLQIFKIQDGGRPPFWKSLYSHISVTNLPISMKFGTQHQILNPITVTWPKIEIFEIRLKMAFLAITHQRIVWYQRNFEPGSRTACRQRPHDKNCKFSKSKMVDSRHFENRSTTISQWNYYWILTKFGVLQHILNLMRF